MNPRFTPTNVGLNAMTNAKERVAARRAGGPFQVQVPQERSAAGRTIQRTMQRKMNGVGRQQVPAELNAIDRDLTKRMERKQEKAQERAQGGE
jgi:hypothetical protein